MYIKEILKKYGYVNIRQITIYGDSFEDLNKKLSKLDFNIVDIQYILTGINKAVITYI